MRLFSMGVSSVLDSSKMPPTEFFRRFHRRNPHIYLLLVRITRETLKKTGRKQLPIRLIWETLRAGFLTYVTTDDAYRLNNNLAPFYARKIMRRERDLAGVFMTRDRVVPLRKIGRKPYGPRKIRRTEGRAA